MTRTNPDWLGEAPLQQFFAATRAAGGEARAVGGAVRDHLLGMDGSDVDIASTLVPEKNIALAAQNGWKAIPTGIDHGTVTIVLPTRVIEVTTLRRDVTTDGRRATVAYTDDWQEDAARRDFTMNALSMDADGKVYDFFDGRKDIAGHRVAFIGDAGQRIEEDALRILRYFRFLATHGKPPADEAALAAITAKKLLIENLSGERIANEMRKLLSAANPAYVLRLMAETGIAPLVFGSSIEPQRMIRLHMLENQSEYQCSVWARAVALLQPSPEIAKGDFDLSQGRGSPASPLATHPSADNHTIAVQLGATSPLGEVDAPEDAAKETATPRASGEGWLIARWKPSRHEAQQLHWLAQQPAFDANAPRHAHTRMLRLHGAPAYLDWLLTQAAVTPGIDIMPYVALAKEFVAPIFPITAKDLMAKGMKEGKALGDRLSLLEQKWEESDYMLTKEELLS